MNDALTQLVEDELRNDWVHVEQLAARIARAPEKTDADHAAEFYQTPSIAYVTADHYARAAGIVAASALKNIGTSALLADIAATMARRIMRPEARNVRTSMSLDEMATGKLGHTARDA